MESSRKLTEGSAWLLTTLFVYTAVSKLYDWRETRFAMYNQGFPSWATELILYGLPIVELSIALLLLIPRWRNLGFILCVALMLMFTGYVSYIWLGFADRVPCSCGGILSSLGWGEHLVVNLVFLGIAIIGLRSHRKVIGFD